MSEVSRESPLPVAVVGKKVSEWISRMGSVWVEGEITQWNVRGSNIFGKLKDLNQDATLSIAIWRNVSSKLTGTFAPGDRVVALVNPNYWSVGGSLSFVVQDISHVGLGELLERLERLRRTLQAEGVFDAEHKQQLPFLPQKIGLVTGRNSDAEKDVLQNASLRWPDVQFRVEYAAVQGERAAKEVIAGIKILDADPDVDVIIVARGGGDFQHLLPFSDEAVIRAAFDATTPIVSAIGHEADRPLLDEVADLRASTPTDAAKRVVPDISEERAGIDQARQRITGQLRRLISVEIDRLQAIRSRTVLAEPARLIDQHRDDLDRWIARSEDLMLRSVSDRSHEVSRLTSSLTALSPKKTLQRGYAIVQNESGQVLATPNDAPADTQLTVTLHGGKIGATSHGTTPESASEAR
ncbi:MAG: exodeoxyribonuclease VII large subunit [Canibacter sp.]